MRQMKQAYKTQGEGMTLSYLGPQNTTSTTEIPLSFSGEKSKTRWSQKLKKNAQKQGQTMPKRGETTPNTKLYLNKHFEDKKSELFLVKS